MEVGNLPGDEEQAAPTETESAVHAVAISGRKVSRQSHIARGWAVPSSTHVSQPNCGEPPLGSGFTSAVSQDAPSPLVTDVFWRPAEASNRTPALRPPHPDTSRKYPHWRARRTCPKRQPGPG